MKEIINFASNLTDAQVTLIALACMLVFFTAGYLYFNNLLMALIIPEVFNCFNLSIIITNPWLGLDTKPFLPLWISLVLLLLPFVVLMIMPILWCTKH